MTETESERELETEKQKEKAWKMLTNTIAKALKGRCVVANKKIYYNCQMYGRQILYCCRQAVSQSVGNMLWNWNSKSKRTKLGTDRIDRAVGLPRFLFRFHAQQFNIAQP